MIISSKVDVDGNKWQQMAINGNKWQGPPALPPDTAQIPVLLWGRRNPSNKFYIFEQFLYFWTKSTFLTNSTFWTRTNGTCHSTWQEETREAGDDGSRSAFHLRQAWDQLRFLKIHHWHTYWYLNKITCGQFRLLETNCFSSSQNATHHHLIF